MTSVHVQLPGQSTKLHAVQHKHLQTNAVTLVTDESASIACYETSIACYETSTSMLKVGVSNRRGRVGEVKSTLTSRGGSMGPPTVQIAAVCSNRPADVMLLPKSNVADTCLACIKACLFCTQLMTTAPYGT